MPPKNQQNRMSDLLASITEDMIDGSPQQFQDNTVRVERILLDLVRPDPVQPRRVLPEQIHFAFHNNRLTPSQSLRELVQIVQVAARQRGRPFHSVLELLPNPDDESEEDQNVKLSPEEHLLRDLVNLAVTIRDDGQVNPLTVVDVSQGVTHLFRIETGERRYWATWLLRDFIPNYTGDGMIPCIVIPAEKSSIFRQAKENTSRTGLSAIAMARQAALLLLTVHSFEIPMTPVSPDFYRQALDLDLRGKREFTDLILSAMGSIGKMQFSRYKALLRLSDDAMELADRHNLEEGLLRYVLTLPTSEHAEMIQQIIQFGLSGKQVKEICEGAQEETTESESRPSISTARLVKIMRGIEKETPSELATVLMGQEKNAHIAKARLETMISFLRAAVQHGLAPFWWRKAKRHLQDKRLVSNASGLR